MISHQLNINRSSDVLVALYDATNGDGWRYNTNRLSDESICEWYGVQCNSGGHVFGIHIAYNSLQGTIPSELGLLTSLRWLWVEGNSLQGTIPTELGLLTSLQDLIVYDNSLTGAVPNEVCALRDINGGSLWYLYADCVEEVECTCCTSCCVDGGFCSPVVN